MPQEVGVVQREKLEVLYEEFPGLEDVIESLKCGKRWFLSEWTTVKVERIDSGLLERYTDTVGPSSTLFAVRSDGIFRPLNQKKKVAPQKSWFRRMFDSLRIGETVREMIQDFDPAFIVEAYKKGVEYEAYAVTIYKASNKMTPKQLLDKIRKDAEREAAEEIAKVDEESTNDIS